MYQLYARVLVGSGGFNDDSMFYGNGFGAKSSAADGDWQLVNGLASGGFTATTDVVAGNGSAGVQVWKWVNLSQFNPTNSGTETPITFTVSAGNLTQTFQIGGRENGLGFDKFVFGTTGVSFTVSNLDAGTLPPPRVPSPSPMLFRGRTETPSTDLARLMMASTRTVRIWRRDSRCPAEFWSAPRSMAERKARARHFG